jgi:fructose 1,6-bisphosphatase
MHAQRRAEQAFDKMRHEAPGAADYIAKNGPAACDTLSGERVFVTVREGCIQGRVIRDGEKAA